MALEPDSFKFQKNIEEVQRLGEKQDVLFEQSAIGTMGEHEVKQSDDVEKISNVSSPIFVLTRSSSRVSSLVSV